MRSPSRWIVGAVATVAVLIAVSGRASVFGVNSHIPSQRIVDEVAGAGIGWVRIDFVWSAIEVERDVYDWSRYDALLDRLEADHLRVFATLQATPEWATSGAEISGVPDDPSEWQEFCYLAAARYRGRVHAWGLWNEPNLDHFWQGTRTDYIELILLPGAAAIRSGDPGALICAADLAHLSSAHWEDWMRRVLADAGDVIDVLVHHYYPSYGTAFEVLYDFDKKAPLPWGSPSLRKVLQEEGWWGRPFWLTETGVESHKHGEGDQADFYRDLLNDWFGLSPEAQWMDRVFFYQMADPASPTGHTWGIVNSPPDYLPKRAYDAYTNFISAAEIDDAELTAHTTPTFVASSTVRDITVTFRNTGTTSWTADGDFALIAAVDGDGWQVEPGWLPARSEVLPGESIDLNIRVTSPATGFWEPVPVVLTAYLVDGNGRRFSDLLRQKIVFTDDSPPVVQTHPLSATVPPRRSVALSIEATSDSWLDYRWRRNTVELTDDDRVAGAETAELTIYDVDRHLIGDYDCIVSNAAGEVVSLPATITLGSTSTRNGSGRRNPSAAVLAKWARHRNNASSRVRVQPTPDGAERRRPVIED